HLREGKQYLRINSAPVEPKGHATEIFTRWACDFIATSAEQQRPFFLYLAYNAPHNPIQPPPEWISNYKKQFPKADEKRALYGAFVAHLDQQIGLVLQALQKAGAEQNTLVVFTSDNGAALPHGGSNGSYHSGKPTLYEGGLRVPAMVRFPGVVKPAQQSDVFALTTDIMPTICQMLDQPPQNCPPTDGISFWHILTNQTTNNHSIKPTLRQIFWTVRDADGIFGKGSTLEALRKGNLKIMRTLPDSLPELYDLAADPLETINLADTHAQVYRQLLTELDSIKNRVNAIPYQSQAVWGR
ncbi:MAG TPA: sulfatase-like hydrolase/transferase, partial [Chitinophagales bacterium]|nr:sulfatase-like hydrolase/transferase [Chitinophagales bacterium]